MILCQGQRTLSPLCGENFDTLLKVLYAQRTECALALGDLALVKATSNSLRSSSTSASDSVAKSDGMLPSAACRTKTNSHSSPFAEWMALRVG